MLEREIVKQIVAPATTKHVEEHNAEKTQCRARARARCIFGF